MGDYRIIRGRQAALAADVDAARSARPEMAARRRVVQVVDGGHMPTSPDHWFLGELLDVGGAEAEGGTPATATVGADRVPFVALHKAPAVGDRVIITSVGGRWVGELGGCKSTICVAACAGQHGYLVGALIEVLDGDTVLDSCTTTATGCCTFAICGLHRVRVTAYGQVMYDSSRNLSATGTTLILLSGDDPPICCDPYVIPRTLYLTDAGGTIPLVYFPHWYYPMWTGGHAVPRLSAPVTMPAGLCDVGDASEGPVRVCYQLICHAGQDPAFTVQRSWSWVYRKGDLTAIWYQDDTGFVPGQFCATAPPPLCGNPLTDVGTFDANPDSTAPFLLRGTPRPALGNATGDPVGGGVVISQ